MQRPVSWGLRFVGKRHEGLFFDAVQGVWIPVAIGISFSRQMEG